MVLALPDLSEITEILGQIQQSVGRNLMQAFEIQLDIQTQCRVPCIKWRNPVSNCTGSLCTAKAGGIIFYCHLILTSGILFKRHCDRILAFSALSIGSEIAWEPASIARRVRCKFYFSGRNLPPSQQVFMWLVQGWFIGGGKNSYGSNWTTRPTATVKNASPTPSAYDPSMCFTCALFHT